ncbi:unnamed protein product [Pleuronectes platessa]|uniref:Uncharacterized protein n=1 Tax=Pleuronectes platessa TaxID=8262 RepID=A0A9N7TMG5_PLEPL|nr:unnamed protein product [Pleuronectes platessa]
MEISPPTARPLYGKSSVTSRPRYSRQYKSSVSAPQLGDWDDDTRQIKVLWTQQSCSHDVHTPPTWISVPRQPLQH